MHIQVWDMANTSEREVALVLRGDLQYCEDEHKIFYVGDDCFSIYLTSNLKVKISKQCEKEVVYSFSDEDWHTHYFGKYLYLTRDNELYLTIEELKDE